MAILYGTTADGESLPVEVNEFGQLVAKGLQGQPGPPGPGGVGELPPDPFEGAILGWKDNTLSWLGGSVPIPEGTYGPITAYENGLLWLESDVDLPYLTSIDLTDSAGSPLAFSYSTSSIANVVGREDWITFDQLYNPAETAAIPDRTSVANGQRFLVDDLFAKYPYPGNNQFSHLLIPGAAMPWRSFNSDSPDGPMSVGAIVHSGQSNSISWWRSNVFPGKYATCTLTSGSNATPGAVVAQGRIAEIPVDVLTFVDASNFNRFFIGDVLQAPDVRIVSIDPGAAQITTTKGNWLGLDGSGAIGGDTRAYTPDVTGTGTVQSCIENTIVLREDNTNWLIGGYVTAPDQKLAARYVYEDSIRKRLL